MRIDGIQLREGSSVSNLTIASGTAFPSSANTAELFFRTDSDARVLGLYIYLDGEWQRIASTESITVPRGTVFPTQANEGDLFYKNTGGLDEALYVFDGAGWIVASGEAQAGGYTAGAGLAMSNNELSVGSASTARIVINADNIDLATVSNSGAGSFVKLSTDSYGRVSGTTPVVAADITSLVDSAYVNVAGDTMSGDLAMNSTARTIFSNNFGSVSGSAPLTFLNNAETIWKKTPAGGDNEWMRLSSGGLLGIGTDNPQHAIDVQAPASSIRIAPSTVINNALFRASNAGGTAYLGLDSSTGAGLSGVPYALALYHTGAYPILLSTNSTERMRISSTGNVGIGSSDFTTDFMVLKATDARSLGIYRNVNVSLSGAAGTLVSLGALIGSTQTSGGNITGILESSTSGLLTFGTRSGGSVTDKMRIDGSGNVSIGVGGISAPGIGGTGPILDLYSTTSQPALTFHNSVSGVVSVRGGMLRLNGATFEMVNQESNGIVALSTAGFERMRIDSAGKVGISRTPTQKLFEIAGGMSAGYGHDQEVFRGVGDAAYLSWYNTALTSRTGYLQMPANGESAWSNEVAGGSFKFLIGSTVRMLIDSNGTVSIGSTGGWSGFASRHVVSYPGASSMFGTTYRTASTTGTAVVFLYGGGENGVGSPSQVGSITQTTSTTSYNTTSDIRVKENIIDAASASGKIDAIQIREFDFKAGGHVEHGVIAQELVEVVPEAVSQGNVWGVDYSKLVPLLVKEVQELRARVAQLEAAE